MKVCMGNPKNCKSTKVCITQPCFGIQTPDFSRKFIWTVKQNDKIQKTKMQKRVNRKEPNDTKMNKNAKKS